MRAWLKLAIRRDRVLTCTGLAIVWAQLVLWVWQGRAPDPLLTTVGVGMLYPTAAKHVRTVLGTPEAGSSSESSPPPSSAPSSPSQPRGEVAGGEQRAGPEGR